MDLLDQIIARSQAQGMAPSYDPNLTQEPRRKNISLLEWLTGKSRVFPDVPKGAAPAPAIPNMAPQAGLLAPGISGSGAQAAIDSEPEAEPHVPLPVERPREVDGSDNPPTAGADMAARGARGPAGEDDAAAAPIRSASPIQAGAGTQSPAPAALPPQLQQGAGILGGVMPFLQKNSNLLLALGAGMMGPYSLGEGLGRASAYAIPGHEADLKQSMNLDQQRETYKALVQAGVPQQQAIAAVGNSKLADILMQSYIADRKREIKVLKDSLGNERVVSVDPYMSQEELDRANNEGSARNGGNGQAATLSGPGDTSGLARMPIEIDPATGRDEKFAEAFKKADPINYAATENLLNGNMTGNGRNLQQLMKYASRIDPRFDQATFGARQSLYRSYYGGGEGYKGVRAANTAVQHGVDLQKDIEDLHNFTLLPGFLNPVTGAIAKQYSKRYQDALKNFQADKEVYSHELETALTGKSTVTGTKQLADLFDANAPTGANKSALHTTLRDLSQRIEEHENAYNRGMGGKASSNPVHDFLTNRDKLDRLMNGGAASSPNVSASTAVLSEPTAINPENGERVVFRDGKWQPLQ